MTRRILALWLFCTALVFAQPQLRKQGTATQLLVEGKPFVMLGGELHNSSASSLEYMRPIWKRLVALNLNTVLATVSWELVEPQEGKFDFALVDGLIAQAREHKLRLVLLWFGSWKNGVSTYPPLWVKTDLKRFPRAQKKDGSNFDVLSPLADAARDADARAFAALLRHIRQVDSKQQTVIMVQVQNEVGLLGDSRDRSPLAQAAWNKPVPSELMNYLEKHKGALLPELTQVWGSTGFKTAGTWPEVFGENPAGDEVFMAWYLARYIEKIAAAGKAEYALPLFANAWLVQNSKQLPGAYPSGGPVSRMHDIWRAAAPSIDILAPDIYLLDFKAVCASYTRSGNPLLIPEARQEPQHTGNLFYAFGAHDAMAYSPFGIDDLEPTHPLAASYKLISELLPTITQYQGLGKMTAFTEEEEPKQTLTLGDYRLTLNFRFMRAAAKPEPKGFGLIIATGPDEFLLAGSAFSIAFAPVTAGPRIARIAYADEGRFVKGVWTPGRRMNGDEIGGGTHLVMPAGNPGTQKIKLYRTN